MMDIVLAVQAKFGCVSSEAMDAIAKAVSTHRVEVESVVSFYAFLSSRPKGKVVIRLCNDVIDRMHGADRVAEAFRQELGIGFGETTPDGQVSLEYTPCIGMCDQAPAALVNDVVVTELHRSTAQHIVREINRHVDPRRLVTRLGDGNNAHQLVQAMVNNNIRKAGPVIFAPSDLGAGLAKALAMSPAEVIRDIKTARLRGRGGAGFPTGMKWEFARGANDQNRYVVCNADEGEPGTFKDRVILTERPELLIEGMAIAGYAIGASEGIIYLRGEYAYLRAFLEHMLNECRNWGILGQNIGGKKGFHFDIRIQMGAGAYVCGEETALLSSCEGLRGDPKNRPPFPAQKGYQGHPTIVNNVETFCCVTRIMDKGAGAFAQLGSSGSPGTKLLSVSGDCRGQGVYEVEFGIKLRDVLKMVGGEDAGAVQVGGPSGRMVGPDEFDRPICYDHLATGGALMVFGPERNVVDVARQFMEFFVEESCGYCTPCRVGNILLKERLEQMLAGRGERADLAYLQELGETIKTMSRCGLGQTSANPVLSTIRSFPAAYESLLKDTRTDGFRPTFDIGAALGEAQAIVGRRSVHFAD
jgi:[NiFe] hydrogenase diaphorase moiety large subunit